LKYFFHFEDVNVVPGLVYSSCEESKNSQPSPRHTTQTSNSRVSPTTANYMYFVYLIIII